MCDTIKNCCRICLDVESDHICILSNSTILLHIKTCLSINILANDNLSKDICVACVSQLSEFYNFLLNARCSQDWLESSIQDKYKKNSEVKTPIQPLPDSEYNSDSLLEFLNNTANIEDYLNNLGKEDIPSIVNIFDRNDDNNCIDAVNKLPGAIKSSKVPSPKKKETGVAKNCEINMEIDVLDSDIEIVNEILMKEVEPKKNGKPSEKTICFACKTNCETIQKLSQHISICDTAARTCIHCNTVFDSKKIMLEHSITHNTSLPLSCNCGKQFNSQEKLLQHHRVCHADYLTAAGCVYRCKQCMTTFKDRFQLYKHIKNHIMKNSQKICDICGHILIGEEALSHHKIKEHEQQDNMMYRCKVCGITSTNHKEMYLHVKNHTSKSKASCHLCESCGRSFASHTTLMRHSLLHANKGYRCKICSAKFRDEKEKDRHIISQHAEMIMCERCGHYVHTYKLNGHPCV